jgi:hypothetical protein
LLLKTQYLDFDLVFHPPIESTRQTGKVRGAQRREPLALRTFLARKIPLFPSFSEEGFLASLEMTAPVAFFRKLFNQGIDSHHL